MIMVGPFACVRLERLMQLAESGDENAKAVLKTLTVPHAQCVPFRDRAIVELAELIEYLRPGISARARNHTIAALLRNMRPSTANGFSADELPELIAAAEKIVFWMDGARTDLSARQIANIVSQKV